MSVRHTYINERGQGILEMLIALLVLVTALTATVVLITTSINAAKESRNRLVGSNLAREGVEIVRNMRDSNWIDPTSPSPRWDAGLVGAGGDPTATPIIDGINPITLDFASNVFTNILLSNGLYVQGGSGGTATEFFRLLYLNPICRDEATSAEEIVAQASTDDCTSFGANYDQVGIRIISEVRWPSATSNKKMIIEDRLYNWQVL